MDSSRKCIFSYFTFPVISHPYSLPQVGMVNKTKSTWFQDTGELPRYKPSSPMYLHEPMSPN